MYFLSKINSTDIQGTSLTFSQDGTFLLTIQNLTQSKNKNIHFYQFLDTQIISAEHKLSGDDMQYPQSESNYALRTFNGNAICYIFGWGTNGGFSMAKVTYSKEKKKTEDTEFLYWPTIGLSSLDQSVIQFHPQENSIIFIDDSSPDRLVVGEHDFALFTASNGQKIETFEIIESSDSPSYMALLNYEISSQTYWKIIRIDEFEYLNSYNITGSLELGKIMGQVNFFSCDSKTEFCYLGFQNKKFFAVSRELSIVKELNSTYDQAIFTKESKLILGKNRKALEVWEKEMEKKIGYKEFQTTGSFYYEQIDSWKFQQKQYVFLVRNPAEFQIYTPQLQIAYESMSSDLVLDSFSSKLTDKIIYSNGEILLMGTLMESWLIYVPIISFFVLSLLICFLVNRFLSSRKARTANVQTQEISQQRIKKFEQMNKKQQQRIKKQNRRKIRATKEQPCPICLQKNTDVYLYTCRHVFHEKCIDYSLLKKDTCPICRAKTGGMMSVRNITQVFSDYDLESQS